MRSSRHLLLPVLCAGLAFTACNLPAPSGSAATATSPTAASVVEASPRVTRPFDDRWQFALAHDIQDQFPENSWRTVNLPYDWSIEGPFDPQNPTGGAGAFLPSGIAWYRKTFTLPEAMKGRRVFIQFDGVMQNSDVWINGSHLGHRPYGYVSFQYELTGHLRFGPRALNVLAVRTDTSKQPASRWYSGAGIYRHVRLVITDPVHVQHWSTFVTTPEVTREAATVHLRTKVINQSAADGSAVVRFTLLAPDGQPVAAANSDPQPVAAGQATTFAHEFILTAPKLWDLDTPQLYTAVVSVRVDGAVVDSKAVAFGIRDAHFESATGFWLNGRNLKLLGVALHDDGGAFGTAVPLAVWRQRLAALRRLGVNAIRTAHNPPDPGFLDLCDQMGFLVMDEMFDCWEVGKNPYDYHLYFDQWSKTDVRDTVRRDRNHPSIVLYSAGNEIHDTPDADKAKEILAGLVHVFHTCDPTRPVTQALFRPNTSHDYTDGLADLLDVIGTNYRDKELIAAWKAKPGRKIIGTEQQHDRETWLTLRDTPEEAGQFLWTGVDYLGESPRWPLIGAGFGLLDRTGGVKPIGRQRQSWWSAKPMVAITRRVAPNYASKYDPGYAPASAEMGRFRQVLFSDWTPRDAKPHVEHVEVYSNCDSVELFLNGQSLGAQPLAADASSRVWQVPYAPGTLRAIGYNHGRKMAEAELRTAGAPAAIELTADRSAVSPSWDDVDRVTARVVDAHGVQVPAASNLITFVADGPGAVVAVDNGDNASHESFQASQRSAYEGRCVAFVRATAPAGTITLRATAPGLKPAAITIAARK